MRTSLLRISALTLIGAFTLFSFALPVGAENKKITVSAKRPLGWISNTVFTPGDVPNHEIAQRVYSYEITSSDADFNGFKTTNYGQSDDVAGTGTHRGYSAWPLKNGDTVWLKYEGSHKTITKDGGAWETPFEGKFVFVGGTGKYKAIKGGGTYKGKASPEGSAWQSEVEMQY